MAEPVAFAHGAGNEIESASRDLAPRWLFEQQTCVAERGDHQAVPVGQNFVVEAGTHALVAHRKQFYAQRRKPLLIFISARLRLEAIENRVAFEIAGRRHVVMASKKFTVLDAKHTQDLVIRPDIKLALL